MELRIQIVAVVGTLALFLVVLELVRRRRLLERYALVWLGSALVLLALGIWKGLLGSISEAVGIFYPPAALFVIAFGFILVLLLHFSTAVSRLTDQSKVLAQRIALMEERQRELEQRLADAEGGEVPRKRRPNATVPSAGSPGHVPDSGTATFGTEEPGPSQRNLGEPEMFRSVPR
jgi:hypothetical protein